MKKLFAPYAEAIYRQDIQGIRAIGAILILIYHIWVGKVSGGVDVFFVVSGFLMTGLLLRQCAREGRLRPFLFWGNIVKRVSPSAYLVLFATLILGYFFLPPSFWRVSLNDLFFSALHIENFQLLRLSVDYLARENPASPFQQYWALSMQMQFYFVLPLLLGAGLLLARRAGSLRPLIGLLGAVLLLSFAWSLLATGRMPAPAYFDTGARFWEFLAGGLLALVLPHLRLGPVLVSLCGVAGLMILFATGVMVPRGVNFPGYIALLPVAGAILLIVSGANARYLPLASRLLSARWLVAIGGFSFTLYLWHWPLFVYAQYYFESIELNLWQGLVVVLASLGLSWLTTKAVERPLRLLPKTRLWPSYAVGFLFFVPTMLPAVGARQYAVSLYDKFEESTAADPRYFTGQRIGIQHDASGVDLSQFAAVDDNKAEPIMHCLTGELCEYGDLDSDRVVAIVGGSHAAQWESAFSVLGKRYGFKVVTIVQMSCALGWLEGMDLRCETFNNEIVGRIKELKPDLVVTNSTRLDRENEWTVPEVVPNAYVEKWQEITGLGIPVLGIRDNPWFESDPNVCLWNKLETAGECARPVTDLFLQENPAEPYEARMPLFHSVDFSDLICTDQSCPVVFANRLMYFDTHHLSRTYVEFIALAMDHAVREQAGSLLPVPASGGTGAPTFGQWQKKPR
ncbi:acyltransferase family protein [Gilvimarinus sp. F26214L]|uniref:acyltransferase family protein n=1 Tax=Gilvimarinus sp. DZF01 TaxID=3461371 RepID=UPI0040464012